MTPRVSAVVVSQGAVALLERQLPALRAEMEGRAAGDEIVVVDASGVAALAEWMPEHFPDVGLVTCEAGEGPAAALQRGVVAARGELVLVLEPTALLRTGSLAPLVAALADPEVVAAGPRAVDESGQALPAPVLVVSDGRLRPAGDPAGHGDEAPRPVPFLRAAFLARREELAGTGALDPLFETWSCAFLDHGIAAWRAGHRIVEVGTARVARLSAPVGPPPELERAAEEKGGLLLYWKFLDVRQDASDHLATLWRDALDAASSGRREELIWMALALQELPRVDRSRRSLGRARRRLEQVLRVGR